MPDNPLMGFTIIPSQKHFQLLNKKTKSNLIAGQNFMLSPKALDKKFVTQYYKAYILN